MVSDLNWDGPSDVHLGTTGLKGEVVAGVHGAAWVGLIGPAGSETSVAPAAIDMVSPLLKEAFHRPVDESGTVFDTLWAGAIASDERLRRKFSPVDPDGRAGLVLACIQHRAAFMVWTESGAAYLLREDKVVNAVEGGRVLVDSLGELDEYASAPHVEEDLDAPHAFLGGRPVDSAELVLHEVDPPWMLRHGDRLVLAPCAISRLLGLDELVALLGSGPAEGAAHTLQTLVRVRSGMEAPVVVIEIGGLDVGELQADDDTFEHLLEGLEELLPAAFAEQLKALEAGLPAVEDAEDATDPFAPVRGLGAAVEEVAPDLGGARSADLHYTPPGGTRVRPTNLEELPVGETLIPSSRDRDDDAERLGLEADSAEVVDRAEVLAENAVDLADLPTESHTNPPAAAAATAATPPAPVPSAPPEQTGVGSKMVLAGLLVVATGALALVAAAVLSS